MSKLRSKVPLSIQTNYEDRDSSNRTKVLLDSLKDADARWKWWKRNEGSSLFQRLRRIVRFNFYYIFFLFSKKKSFVFNGKTFWGAKIKSILPEYWYWTFLKVPPDDSEIDLARYFIKNVRKGMNVIDVGANLGFYTLLFQVLVDKNGRVDVFEPTPRIFKLLKQTCRDMPNVYLNDMAISDETGDINLYENKRDAASNSIISKKYDKNLSTTIVKATTIDRYCDTSDIKPDLIKIDVEGAEDKVVKGALRTLRGCEPSVAMEVWKDNNEAHKKAIEFLLRNKYIPNLITEDGELVAIENINIPEDLIGRIPAKRAYYNFIFTSAKILVLMNRKGGNVDKNRG